MAKGPQLAGLPMTELAQPERRCGGVTQLYSPTLGRVVAVCKTAARRVADKPGGMVPAQQNGGAIMAKRRRKRKCKYGVVKTGKRKGQCLKNKRRKR